MMFSEMPTPPAKVADAEVADVATAVSATANLSPTFTFFATPSPPLTVSAPVVLEDESVVSEKDDDPDMVAPCCTVKPYKAEAALLKEADPATSRSPPTIASLAT